MSHTPIPWVGLAALVAMFVLPLLPNWLFEGPQTIKHRPHRHICADCNAPWTKNHTCLAVVSQAAPPLRAELHRPEPATELERQPAARIPARQHVGRLP
jgi:hypothetical protein